ncbi:MAG: hypothetical protein CMJ32_00880 [Phycisphaerae bacterium]|nr:hypothetical protein [Phycisphaerae bacterium]
MCPDSMNRSISMTNEQPAVDASGGIQLDDRSNTMGVVGLIFGILGLLTCGLLSTFGLIFSIIGLSKSRNGTAIAGLVMSILGFLMIIPLLIGLLLPALSKARQVAQQSSAVVSASNTIATWKSEHDGTLPSDQEANENLLPGIEKMHGSIHYAKLGDDRYSLSFPGIDGQHGTPDDQVWISDKGVLSKE